MNSPRVTVIIPTYNRSTVLPFAIHSVLGQTFSDFELLVIGDGCTDDSEEVVTAIKDPRLRWINLSANSGHQSAPNNRGLQEARGEFIAYLGHDDLWLRHHLECSIGKLEEAAADISHTLMLQLLPDGNIRLPILPKPEIGVGGAPSCRVHRHRVDQKIGGWNHYRNVHSTPEMDFFARAQAAGFSAVFVPRLTAIKFSASLRKGVYRQRSNHEQDEWSRRMNANADFEVEHLARLVEVVARNLPHEMPIRKLVSTFTAEIVKRAMAKLLRSVNGAEIDRNKKYKGL